MPHFMCLMTPKGNTREAASYGQIFKQHGAYLMKMSKENHLVFAGYTDGDNPGSLSLAILQAENREEAQTIAAEAPAVKEGLLSAEIEPFEVFVSKPVTV